MFWLGFSANNLKDKIIERFSDNPVTKAFDVIDLYAEKAEKSAYEGLQRLGIRNSFRIRYSGSFPANR
jgi:hypothetical protein